MDFAVLRSATRDQSVAGGGAESSCRGGEGSRPRRGAGGSGSPGEKKAPGLLLAAGVGPDVGSGGEFRSRAEAAVFGAGAPVSATETGGVSIAVSVRIALPPR